MGEQLNKVEIVEGNIEGELIEITTHETIRVITKEDLLAEKLKELEEHNAGVEAYLAASNLKKVELETIIKSLS